MFHVGDKQNAILQVLQHHDDALAEAEGIRGAVFGSSEEFRGKTVKESITSLKEDMKYVDEAGNKFPPMKSRQVL